MARPHIIAIIASVVVLFIGSSLAAPTDCPNGQLAKVGETILFRWTIHNYSMRAELINEQISSPLFPIDADSSTAKWLLWLAPSGSDDHLALYVCLESTNTDAHLADYHFRVLAQDFTTSGDVFSGHSERPRQFPAENGPCWGHSKFIPRTSLSNYLWNDDTLHILCDIQVRHKSECAEEPDKFFDKTVHNPLAYTDWCDTHYRAVEVLSSTWEIQNVTQNWGENSTIDSPPIKGSELPLVEWETDFRMRMVEHESGESEKYAGLYVCLLSSKQEGEVLSSNRITVLANETEKNQVFTTPKVRRYSLEEHKPPIMGHCWGWEKALSYSEIEGLLIDGSLTLATEVTRIEEVTACSKDLPSITQPCIAVSKPEDPDTLKVKGISTLVPSQFLNHTGAEPLPQNVLFLYATLSKKQKTEDEKAEEKEEGPSVNANGAFVITGDIDATNVGIAADLLVLAHNNHLEDLKQTCQEILSEKITVESTIRILVAADATESEELKMKTFDFLLANTDQVLSTDAYEKLRDSEHPLLSEISWRVLGEKQPDAE